MITNAVLQQIDAPDRPSTSGDQVWVNGEALGVGGAGVRCCFTDANSVVQYLIDQFRLQADGVLYVEPAVLPAAVDLLVERARVTITPDGQVQQQFLVEKVLPRTSGLSHLQCIVRSV